MLSQLNRRKFLGQSARVGSALSVGYFVNPIAAAESTSSLEKLNIAAIGTHNRAANNIEGVASQNIMAIADIDRNLLEQSGQKYPKARKYVDYRVMLENESEKIDAVVVSTPDHSHAPAAAMALRMNKHVYCEKPLTHTVFEARLLADLAKQNNLVTQMGTQIHADDNYRRVVELIQSGAIGGVREAHVWVGADYSGRRLITGGSAPKHVDWDLWLGPSTARPYCESVTPDGTIAVVHPFNWRWFWDFGTGVLGDYACHYVDLVHWALDLRHPETIAASGPRPFLENATSGLVVTYEYAARGNLPPVTLTWYDGGQRPEIVQKLKDKEGQPLNWESGQLFVGSEGMLLSNYSKHRLLPVDKFADFRDPEPYIPDSIGHHNEWIHAIKNGGPTTCNFEYSGALTEAVLLGVASYRSGETIHWDAANLEAIGSNRAQQFVHKEYRKGWTL